MSIKFLDPVGKIKNPGARKEEFLFSNCNSKSFEKLDWKTKRRGKESEAYDGKGNKITSPDWFPVFVQIDELKEKGLDLMEARRVFNSVA